ncbi:amino acid ABC transporter permease [Brevibacillus fluminis]|uniref:Amino acid ABC transporter permease n=1 Tax=Brevibacillus fluminis TaxID=511487 RepID=A0A3M8DE50_9BACL|nr:amino acid ABC transporter permease [Brevibacillus fluminis]RNB85457.1 amino acid ABC transporter permease [Brevibacillus fluminis]
MPSTNITLVTRKRSGQAFVQICLRAIKQNLFSSWPNTLVTFLLLLVLGYLLKEAVYWIAVTAKWDVIVANFQLLMVGQYPAAETWRVWIIVTICSCLLGSAGGRQKGLWSHTSVFFLALFLLALLLPFLSLASRIWLAANIVVMGAGYLLCKKWPGSRKANLIGWICLVPLAILILQGAGAFHTVDSKLWGGFLLTILIAGISIVCSFPLGFLLALGRRSKLVVVRWFSVAYIELIRGVPLIAVLFMAQLMVPLFLGEGIELSNVLRAIIGFTLFNAAYFAETVRGGLQAIPRGQFEAADALGLSYIQKMGLVISPQAIRAVIPALVGNVIEVFKDTSLVAIVSLLDLIGIAKRIAANPQFLGTQMEVYLFVAFIFIIFCFFMSYISKSLERSFNVGR